MQNTDSRIDWLLIIPVILITLMGIMTLVGFNLSNVSQVSQALIWKHVFSIILGISSSFIISRIDYRSLSSIVQPLFFMIILLLILVLFIADTVNGAKSWFSLGFINLQPSEFAKIASIIIIAHYITRYHYRLNDFIAILISLLPIGVISFLILLQPDFGTTSIIVLVWLGMIVFGGAKLRHILILFLIGALIFTSLWFLGFKDYQRQRILTFLDPTTDPLGSGYNTLQSIKSVSAGGLLGAGKQIVSVPEVHTDFIFAGFAQQWGFVGTSFYFFIVMFIVFRMAYIGLKSQDSFARMIVLGVLICFIVQLTINIGMNIGIFPITGVPLPFMSYGGSSMLVSWILIGLVLSVHRHKVSQGTIFMRDNSDLIG